MAENAAVARTLLSRDHLRAHPDAARWLRQHPTAFWFGVEGGEIVAALGVTDDALRWQHLLARIPPAVFIDQQIAARRVGR